MYSIEGAGGSIQKNSHLLKEEEEYILVLISGSAGASLGNCFNLHSTRSCSRPFHEMLGSNSSQPQVMILNMRMIHIFGLSE